MSDSRGDTWLPQELIRAKRDGRALPPEAIRELVAGITDGRLADAQVGAPPAGYARRSGWATPPPRRLH